MKDDLFLTLAAQVDDEEIPYPVPDAVASLLSCLNQDGFLDQSLFVPSDPVKRKLICVDLNDKNAQEFCLEAAKTIAENIRFACSVRDSYFLSVPMKKHIVRLCRISERGDLRSAISLSLLVHASKCASKKHCIIFFGFLQTAFTFALFSIDVRPPRIFEKAKRFLYSANLSTILLQNLSPLTMQAIREVKFRFVEFPSNKIRGWCAPSMVILNVYALKDTLHLSHVVPLTVLSGHEMRHALERRHAGNDFNFSTPEAAAETNPDVVTGHRESGHVFEVAAVGGKYSFDAVFMRTEQELMLNQIEASFRGEIAPALDEANRRRFSIFELEPNFEMPFEFDFESDGRYFSE